MSEEHEPGADAPTAAPGHLHGAIGTATSSLLGVLGTLGRVVRGGLGLGHPEAESVVLLRKPPGTSPGIESDPHADTPPVEGHVTIECIDYSTDRIESTEVADLTEFLCQPRPDWTQVRWILVHGLHPWVVKRLKEHFRFHTLAAEDVLNTMQRPKLEDYSDHLFLVLRRTTIHQDRLHNEQISVILFRDLVITFQEEAGDLWEPIRKRLHNPDSRLRSRGVGYLLYAMLDAVVDHCFPLLEGYGDLLEELEGQAVREPSPVVQRRIHAVKRELMAMRRNLWPLRDVLSELERDENDFLDSYVRTYLRDVYDHAIQAIDIVETYREMAGGLNELYMSAISNRMNEIMKVLTIMASFFIPITFVAGVYGMNFEFIPELHWRYAYPAFWILCASMVGGLMVYFRRKGWMGG